MALELNSVSLSRRDNPPTAQASLTDQDGCVVIVNVKLEGKPVDEFSLKDLGVLAMAAAKHLTHED